MIIEVLKGYKFIKDGKIIAFEENGKLKLRPSKGKFKEVMYDVTYKLKGNTRCYYCGQEVKPSKITLDHIYPIALGGPTLPENLAPSCRKCNGNKEDMTLEQFRAYMSLADIKKQKAFKQDFFRTKYFQEKWVHVLPNAWTSKTPIGDLIVLIDLHDTNTNKYRKTKEYYLRCGQFPKPIIIDCHRFVLDGFTEVLYAKNNKIQEIPTIILENVEVIF